MRYLWLLIICSHVIYAIDIKQERHVIENFIAQAEQVLQSKPLSRACHEFVSDPRWNHALTSLFLMEYNGHCLFFGRDPEKVWEKFTYLKTFDNTSAVEAIIKSAEAGTWVTLMLNNFFVHVFGKKIIKNNVPYILGVFTYHWCLDLNIMFLVNKAHMLIQKKGIHKAKLMINNPAGKFMRGTCSVALYDMNGLCLANPSDQRLVGRVVSSLRDDDNKPIFQGLVEAVQGSVYQNWYQYTSSGTLRRDFIRKIYDQNTQQEVLAVAGYYPLLDDEFVKKFVYKAADVLRTLPHPNNIEHLKKNKFKEAGLYLMVFDTKGLLLANTEYPAAEGNQLILAENKKNNLLKTIISMTLKKDETWIVTSFYGIPYAIFAKKVTVGSQTYIVAAFNYTPETLHFEAVALSHALRMYLEELEEPFIQFVTNLPRYLLKPGIEIEIYSPRGYCIGGNNHYKLWNRAPRKWWNQLKSNKEDRWISTQEYYGKYHHYTLPFIRNKQEHFLSVGYYQ